MRGRRAELWLWAASAAALATLAIYFAHGRGRLDFADHARGRDFVNLWTASRLMRAGRVVEVFDPKPFLAAAHHWFSPRLPFHFWSYPPPALWLAAPLTLFGGYFSALAAWTAAGLVALAAALRPALRRMDGLRLPAGALWLALLSPAVATNVALGQNGAVTAALLLGGLALVDERPALAGALLGALVFKPQIALLLPVVVIAGRRWRLMGGAAASVAAILALTLLVWGWAPWRAFLDHTLPMQAQMLSHGRGPFLWMMTSTFASLRLLGAPAAWASAAQAPFALLGAALVWRVWRTPAAPVGLRIATTVAATFVATPQGFNYDLVATVVAALALWAASPRPADQALSLALWALPPVMIVLGFWRLPVAPLVLSAAAWRLAQLAVGASPTRAASASAAAEAASNT